MILWSINIFNKKTFSGNNTKLGFKVYGFLIFSSLLLAVAWLEPTTFFRKGKYHCTADLLFNFLDSAALLMLDKQQIYFYGRMKAFAFFENNFAGFKLESRWPLDYHLGPPLNSLFSFVSMSGLIGLGGVKVHVAGP